MRLSAIAVIVTENDALKPSMPGCNTECLTTNKETELVLTVALHAFIIFVASVCSSVSSLCLFRVFCPAAIWPHPTSTP